MNSNLKLSIMELKGIWRDHKRFVIVFGIILLIAIIV
jgi:hypothetical protein|tara:strand:+ start:1037 stop:1147 length:111 start_codon:yes stop_codon:yes gene_type:complete